MHAGARAHGASKTGGPGQGSVFLDMVETRIGNFRVFQTWPESFAALCAQTPLYAQTFLAGRPHPRGEDGRATLADFSRPSLASPSADA